MNNKKLIIKSLKKRGVVGDCLLDTLDTLDELNSVGATVLSNGMVKLYHGTSLKNAILISTSELMTSKEDSIFFSTYDKGQVLGYGSKVLSFLAPLELLKIDDIFDNEAHVRVVIGKPFVYTNIREKGLELLGMVG